MIIYSHKGYILDLQQEVRTFFLSRHLNCVLEYVDYGKSSLCTVEYLRKTMKGSISLIQNIFFTFQKQKGEKRQTPLSTTNLIIFR